MNLLKRRITWWLTLIAAYLMPLWYWLLMEEAMPVLTRDVPTWLYSTGLAASFGFGMWRVIRQLKLPSSFLALRVAAGYLTCIVYGLATLATLCVHSGCEPEYVALHPIWEKTTQSTIAKYDECGNEASAWQWNRLYATIILPPRG